MLMDEETVGTPQRGGDEGWGWCCQLRRMKREREGSCGISRCIAAVSPCAAEKCIRATVLAADTPLITGQQSEISATGLQ